MAEQHNSDARRRRRRRRGPSNRGPEGQSTKPSGLSRFLSIISFGLLGKSKSKPKPRPQPAPPVRFEGGSGGGSARPPREDRPRRERGERPERAPREPRQAEPPREVTTERLYVGNLSYDATESDLFDLFNGVGKVQNAEVVVNNRTQRSKGFAFITMASVEEAKRAVAELRDKEFMGRALQVSGAKPPQLEDEERREQNGAEAQPDEEAAA